MNTRERKYCIGLLDEILDFALKKASSAEIFAVISSRTLTKFRNNELKTINTEDVRGIGLRVIKNKRIGFSSTTSSDYKALVNRAILTTKFGQKAYFTFPEEMLARSVKLFDANVQNLDLTEIIYIGDQIVDLVKRRNRNVRCNLDITKEFSETFLVNSNASYQFKRTIWGIDIEGTLATNEGVVTGYESDRACNLSVNYEKMVERLAEKVTIAEKRYDVNDPKAKTVFLPKAMISVLYPLIVAIDAKYVQRGASPIAGKIGTGIFDEKLGVYDDGTIDYAAQSGPIDCEGIKTQKTEVIEDGVLKSFLYDLQTAGREGRKSTGNGIRDYDSQPSPSPTNFCVEEGEFGFEEMIEDMRNGIIVDRILGTRQSNVLSGEFSVSVGLGFKVKNGQIIGGLKNPTVTGNTYEAMNSIQGIGEKIESVYGFFRIPPFYFDSLNVSEKN